MSKNNIDRKTEKKENAERQIIEQSRVIKYDTLNYAIDYLVERFNPDKETFGAESNGEFRFVIPDYQRQSVWDDKDRSFFIESLFLGLPIPFLFLGERQDGIMEIVDGVQRITTLKLFINDDFTLAGLKKLTDLNGMKFSDFSEATQRKFCNKSLRIIVLDSATPRESRENLFQRVNKSGRKIEASEFRRANFRGALTIFIEKCSENEQFKRICPLSDKKLKRYMNFELVLRFFAYINEYQDFKHAVEPFLDSFLERNLNSFDEPMFEKEFYSMCDFVEKNFPLGFGTEKNGVPNIRFEAISVGVGLALRENPSLTIDNVDWLNCDEFRNLTTSDSSNNPGRLSARVEFVRDCLLGRKNG